MTHAASQAMMDHFWGAGIMDEDELHLFNTWDLWFEMWDDSFHRWLAVVR